jgi:hypothetical protein
MHSFGFLLGRGFLQIRNRKEKGGKRNESLGTLERGGEGRGGEGRGQKNTMGFGLQLENRRAERREEKMKFWAPWRGGREGKGREDKFAMYLRHSFHPRHCFHGILVSSSVLPGARIWSSNKEHKGERREEK